MSCACSPASLFCECVSLAPRAPYTLSSAVWCLGLSRACAVYVLTHVFSSRTLPSRAARGCVVWLYSTPLAPLPSARCACRGRCLQAGRELRHAVSAATLVRRWEHLVVGACASKVCIANGELHLSSGLALLCFPRSSTVVLPPLPSRPCAGGHPMSPLCTSLL